MSTTLLLECLHTVPNFSCVVCVLSRTRRDETYAERCIRQQFQGMRPVIISVSNDHATWLTRFKNQERNAASRDTAAPRHGQPVTALTANASPTSPNRPAAKRSIACKSAAASATAQVVNISAAGTESSGALGRWQLVLVERLSRPGGPRLGDHHRLQPRHTQVGSHYGAVPARPWTTSSYSFRRARRMHDRSSNPRDAACGARLFCLARQSSSSSTLGRLQGRSPLASVAAAAPPCSSSV